MNDERRKEHLELAEKLLSEQNFVAAVIAGASGAVVAAMAYGIVVNTWPFSHGFAAAGIGIVVGFPMGFLGRGIATRFAVAAGLFTIAACALGKLLQVVIGLAPSASGSLIGVFQYHSVSTLLERSFDNTSFIDLVYWFVAVVCAAFLSRRALSRSERLAVGHYQSKTQLDTNKDR